MSAIGTQPQKLDQTQVQRVACLFRDHFRQRTDVAVKESNLSARIAQKHMLI